MKNNSKTPRFDVDFKQRLEQQQTANNAVRLPRLGYKLYRIYAITEKKQTVYPSNYNNQSQWQQVLWAFIDEMESKAEPAYEVKWLKPKHATLLRMRGHRVEPAQPGDRVGHVGPIDKPVRLGR